MFPAHAGMARSDDGWRGSCHMCSPRMRGWPGDNLTRRVVVVVFPAHAGMARLFSIFVTTALSVPRACGDGPYYPDGSLVPDLCSPRMRGWPATSPPVFYRYLVFPAHAGMARRAWMKKCSSTSVPRACGDGPGTVTPGDPDAVCSPRMRGWPAADMEPDFDEDVFPAHAGMARRNDAVRQPA